MRIVRFRAIPAPRRWITQLCQFVKLSVHPKKLSNCLGETEPHLHSPEDETMSDPHSLGTPDNQPYHFDVERADDDGEKKTLSCVDGDD